MKPRNHEETEQCAVEALCSVLDLVPPLELQNVELAPEASEVDFIVELNSRSSGSRYTLGCEVKSSGQPRFAEVALLKLAVWKAKMPPGTPTVFIAPYISPAVRDLCIAHDTGYLDFAGNCRLAFGEVFVERTVAEVPQTEYRELKSIYKPKSARVLRLLLMAPDRAWKVKDLSAESGVSIGQVSNVRSALLNRQWIAPENRGVVLTNPGAMLDEWREHYEVPAQTTLSLYTALHGAKLESAIRNLTPPKPDGGPLVVLSSFSAADWIAPYGRTGKSYFYADRAGIEILTDALSLRPARAGANVQITVPKDDGIIMHPIEPSPGVLCTNVIQTYLDLYVSGERGQESAQHLRETKLSW